jgi:hypothetical protein
MIKLVSPDACLCKTISDGVVWKRGVMLLSGKALLLRRGDDPAVIDQRGGAVVIEGRNAKDPHRTV